MNRPRLRVADPEQEARLLARIIETISAGLDLDEIVQRVAGVITDTTETDVCFVWICLSEGRDLELRGATPPFDRLAGGLTINFEEGVSGWVATHRRPAVLVDDKLADPRYKYLPELRGEDFSSMASVPIVTPLGHLVGVLNVHTRQRREFTEADVELLRSVAGLMAGAIENARLHRRLAEREEALEKFAERMVQLQESERRRLAGEIHDGISQRLVSLSFHLSAAADALPRNPRLAGEQIAQAQQLSSGALDETRFAIAGLRPPVLDDLGLAASLESLARTLPGLTVEVNTTARPLSEHVETAVYRIAQEALQNVAKHANAGRVVLDLTTHDHRVVLRVEDDGRGFDPCARQGRAGPTGYGLAGMRERAELLDGRLDIHSAPGLGTLLHLTLPLVTRQSGHENAP